MNFDLTEEQQLLAHTSSLHPLAESTIFARLSIEYSFAKYRLRLSASSCCSSVKSKFIEQLLNERGRHAAPRRPAGPGGGPGGTGRPLPAQPNDPHHPPCVALLPCPPQNTRACC